MQGAHTGAGGACTRVLQRLPTLPANAASTPAPPPGAPPRMSAPVDPKSWQGKPIPPSFPIQVDEAAQTVTGKGGATCPFMLAQQAMRCLCFARWRRGVASPLPCAPPLRVPPPLPQPFFPPSVLRRSGGGHHPARAAQLPGRIQARQPEQRLDAARLHLVGAQVPCPGWAGRRPAGGAGVL